MNQKIDYLDAIQRGKEAGTEDAENQASRNPQSWFPDDFYGAFVDTPSAMAFSYSYRKAYDRQMLLEQQEAGTE